MTSTCQLHYHYPHKVSARSYRRLSAILKGASQRLKHCLHTRTALYHSPATESAHGTALDAGTHRRCTDCRRLV